MKLFTAALLAAFLFVSPLKADLDPVQPLKNKQHQTFCTTFSINEKEDYWATARHCVRAAQERGYGMFILGEKASVVFESVGDDDVAILEAETDAPSLKLSKEPLEVGDEVVIKGFPYGLPRLIKVKGYLAAKGVPLGPGAPISDILDITVAGGNSGSPVLNEDGKVVGLLWGGFVNSPHAASIPWETLKRIVGDYFKH